MRFYLSERLSGTAALKKPTEDYRKRCFQNAGITNLERSFPLELGYVVTHTDLRGRGLAHLLVAAALNQREKETGVFATSESSNFAMHRILDSRHFERAGKDWPAPRKDESQSPPCSLFVTRAGVIAMNVVSFSEDILDRLIEDVQLVRSKLNTPDIRPETSAAHLKACETVCEELISKLQRAKEIAADPEMGRAFLIDVLQIENARLRRELERAAKDLTRVQSKFAEHRIEAERDRNVQAARAVEAEE